MGTHIDVYLSHDLPRFDDDAAILARLRAVLPAACAVRDYWLSVDPDYRETDHWEGEPVSPRSPNLRRYSGPGALNLCVTPAAARVFTGARWRGFLSFEPLRRVHVAAFRAIAETMRSELMAICHDSSPAWETFHNGSTLEQCIASLRYALGPPQPSVASVAPNVVQQAKHRVPDVWYLERLLASD